MPIKTPDFEMPLGLQLYSIRDDCAKDFPGALEAVAKMGYDAVEYAGYHDCSAADLRKITDDLGLVCCGTHTGIDLLSDDNINETVDVNLALGNKYVVVPWLGCETRQDWIDVAKRFNDLAAQLETHGLRLGYHNHHHEFTELEGEKPWDTFFGNTRADIIMQVDTGNMMHGGGEPAQYIKAYPGRATTVHLKEYSATNPNAQLGEGDIDWPSFVGLCRDVGKAEWYIVEQEVYSVSPMECVEICIRNLREIFEG